MCTMTAITTTGPAMECLDVFQVYSAGKAVAPSRSVFQIPLSRTARGKVVNSLRFLIVLEDIEGQDGLLPQTIASRVSWQPSCDAKTGSLACACAEVLPAMLQMGSIPRNAKYPRYTPGGIRRIHKAKRETMSCKRKCFHRSKTKGTHGTRLASVTRTRDL